MIALDTNILARFYVIDENDAESAPQHARAAAVLRSGERFYVPKTVILELEWVLRAFYKYERANILKVFDHLTGLPMLHLEDEGAVATALQHYRNGLDFADALHLASSSRCEAMLTFDDRGFHRPARKRGLTPEVRLPAK